MYKNYTVFVLQQMHAIIVTAQYRKKISTNIRSVSELSDNIIFRSEFLFRSRTEFGQKSLHKYPNFNRRSVRFLSRRI